MRQVRIRAHFGPKSPMRWFKEFEINHACWTFKEEMGSIYNHDEAVEEVKRLHRYGFRKAEICEVRDA